MAMSGETSLGPGSRQVAWWIAALGFLGAGFGLALGRSTLALGLAIGTAVGLLKWAMMRPALSEGTVASAEEPRRRLAVFMRRAGWRVGLACVALVAAVPLGLPGLLGVLIGQSLEMWVYMVAGFLGAWRGGSEGK